MRHNFHTSLSFPPGRWRDKGWSEIRVGQPCWCLLTRGPGLWYDAEKCEVVGTARWRGKWAAKENILFVIRDTSGTEYHVDASKCFVSEREARNEQHNLNEWSNNMGKQWPHEQVSEAGALAPEGLLTVKVEEGEESEARNGKYMIKVHTRIMEPKSAKNQKYAVNFVIGNDDDLSADEDDTWLGSFAASRYKSFLKAADVPETGDIEEELESLAGAVVVIDNGHSEDNKYNDPRAFYRRGEREDDEPQARSRRSEPEPEDEPAPRKPAPKSAKKPAGRRPQFD